MSSIWSSGASAAGASPFATTGMAPTPGGGRAAKFQSALQSMGKAQPANSSKSPSGNQTATQPGLSPAATSTGVKSMDSSSGSSGATDGSDSGSTISANDFLTLLVTEMQNQDPTADTDPNEYINQLVQINSLEQLISINQNLSTVLGAASTPAPSATGSTASGSGATASQGIKAVAGGTGPSARVSGANATAPRAAKGNLSLPTPSPASRTVAHALDGHPRPGQSRTGQAGHAIRDIPTRPIQ